MLQTLLHILAQQLHVLEQRVELHDGMAPHWKAAQLAASAAPTLLVSEYIISHKSKHDEDDEQEYQGENESAIKTFAQQRDGKDLQTPDKIKPDDDFQSDEVGRPFRSRDKRRADESTQPPAYRDSTLLKLISQEEIRKEKVIRIIRQRADSKELPDVKPEPMGSGAALNVRELLLPKKPAETIIVVRRQSPIEEYESDEEANPVLCSFVTLGEFKKLETTVQSLINPTNAAILESARQGRSTDTISGIWKNAQLEGRLGALEQGIEEMSNLITNLVSYDQPINELRNEMNAAISGLKEKEEAQLAKLTSRWMRATDVLQRKTDDTAEKVNNLFLDVQKCFEMNEKVDDCILQVRQLTTTLDEELITVQRQISSVDQNVSDIIDRMNAAGLRDRDYFDLLESNKKTSDNVYEIFETIKEMERDRDTHTEGIHALLDQIEILKNTRPTNEEMQEAVRTKADQVDLNGVLHTDQFQATYEYLARGIEGARAETERSEQRVTLMINNLEEHQVTKADLVYLEEIDRRTTQRHNKLRNRLELAIAMVPGLAAASRKRLLSNVNCMTCDTDVLMEREELKPHVPALPVFRSGRDSGGATLLESKTIDFHQITVKAMAPLISKGIS